MNVLFMSLIDFTNLEEHNIYTDLLMQFHKDGHRIVAISPVEKRKKEETQVLIPCKGVKILKLKIGNMQKTNVIEKGMAMLAMEYQFIHGIKKYLKSENFDLILYATPPITLQKAVRYVKKRDKAVSYLMLKDIFPQNAIDLGLLSKKSILYKYFIKKEQYLYRDSDYIGCMSRGNMDYIKTHNADLEYKLRLCSNYAEPLEWLLEEEERKYLRNKYGIPDNKVIFIYGGNLGKPQGISFMTECLKKTANLDTIHFLIIGSGTEYGKLEALLKDNSIKNVNLFQHISKYEYEKVVELADVGLVFLDHRFTIPNFPSRILSYMQHSLGIIAATDKNTDIRNVIIEGHMGYWCESCNVSGFAECVQEIIRDHRYIELGKNANAYFKKHYTAQKGYESIIEQLGLKEKNNENNVIENNRILEENV